MEKRLNKIISEQNKNKLECAGISTSIENNVLQIKKGIPLFEIMESDNDEFIILDETESIFCEDVCGIALYGKQIHVYYKMDRAGRMMKKEYKF